MKRISRTDFVSNRDEFILSLCKEKRVLHIGATDWPFTREKLDKGQLLYVRIGNVAKEQIGIDLDEESATFLNKKDVPNSTVLVLDMNTVHDLDFTPDIILFGETIEHLINPGIALDNLKKVMTEDTILVTSTPNAFALKNFANAFRGIERQHPDHSMAFTYRTLIQLLAKCDLAVINAKFTFLPGHTQSDDLNWKGKFESFLRVWIGSRFPLLASTLLIVAQKNSDK